MKTSIRLLLLCSLISVCTVSNAESFLSHAEKYAVRVKSSISYPFAEDKAGTFEGAGFLIDKERGWFLTNAHVSGVIFQLDAYQPYQISWRVEVH